MADETLENIKPDTIVRQGQGDLDLDADHLLCAVPAKNNPSEPLTIHLDGLKP